jgi:hypothetical protein
MAAAKRVLITEFPLLAASAARGHDRNRRPRLKGRLTEYPAAQAGIGSKGE